MKVKTGEVKTDIIIRVIPNLKGCVSSEKEIRQRILEIPYKLWDLDAYNVVEIGNGELIDIYVYEGVNNTIFTVCSIF